MNYTAEIGIYATVTHPNYRICISKNRKPLEIWSHKEHTRIKVYDKNGDLVTVPESTHYEYMHVDGEWYHEYKYREMIKAYAYTSRMEVHVSGSLLTIKSTEMLPRPEKESYDSKSIREYLDNEENRIKTFTKNVFGYYGDDYNFTSHMYVNHDYNSEMYFESERFVLPIETHHSILALNAFNSETGKYIDVYDKDGNLVIEAEGNIYRVVHNDIRYTYSEFCDFISKVSNFGRSGIYGCISGNGFSLSSMCKVDLDSNLYPQLGKDGVMDNVVKEMNSVYNKLGFEGELKVACRINVFTHEEDDGE